jgi:hypothetical protein
VLLSSGDCILRGLYQNKLHRLDARLQTMVTSTMVAHQQLRGALEGELGRQGWGVLHRALRIFFELKSRLEVSYTTRTLMG